MPRKIKKTAMEIIGMKIRAIKRRIYVKTELRRRRKKHARIYKIIVKN